MPNSRSAIGTTQSVSYLKQPWQATCSWKWLESALIWKVSWKKKKYAAKTQTACTQLPAIHLAAWSQRQVGISSLFNFNKSHEHAVIKWIVGTIRRKLRNFDNTICSHNDKKNVKCAWSWPFGDSFIVVAFHIKFVNKKFVTKLELCVALLFSGQTLDMSSILGRSCGVGF